MGSVRPDYDTFGPFREKVKGFCAVVGDWVGGWMTDLRVMNEVG